MTQSKSFGRGSTQTTAPTAQDMSQTAAEALLPSRSAKNRHRTFSAAFKAEVILLLISGQKTQAELCREHELSQYMLQLWKEQFIGHASAAFESPEQHNAQEIARVAELERLLGRTTLENSILKKASQRLSTLKRGENS